MHFFLNSKFRQGVMNYQGIKKKLLCFKSIFTAHWAGFMASHPRYDTIYYQAEIAKIVELHPIMTQHLH